MSKLIFLDVDGTLVDYENCLPDSAVVAIRAARSKGHRVYLCTGRSRAEVYPPLWDIGLDGMIGGNGSYQDHLDSAAAFPDLNAGTWGGAGETALFGDLGVKDITKARAVDALLAHLGAKRADAIAFGDAKADIPMFDACAYSVCMGSGGEEAKLAADYVTAPVDEDGLFKAFDALGLL